MRTRTAPDKRAKGSEGRDRFLFFLLLAAAFFTGVHHWLRHHQLRFKEVKLAQRASLPSRVLRVRTTDLFPGGEGVEDSSNELKADVNAPVRGRVIENFRDLLRRGVIPRSTLPFNTFRAPDSWRGANDAIPRQDDMALIADTETLGRFVYDGAMLGNDTFTFKTAGRYAPGPTDYWDVADIGYVFLASPLAYGENASIHLQMQTTDSCHMLRAALAEQARSTENANASPDSHAPEWADLTPEELQVLDKALAIIRESGVTADMSDYEKARRLADYLRTHLAYHDLADKTSVYYRHRGKFVTYALMPLIRHDGKGKAICEGYTKTYGLLLTLCGIPSMEVAGIVYDAKKRDGMWHAWNLVHLQGQGWYHVDTTWMRDAHSKYFMCTDKTLQEDAEGNRAWATPSLLGRLPAEFSKRLSYPASATAPAH